MFIRLRQEMLFFNYETIYLASLGNPDKMLKLLCSSGNSGTNWIKNPWGLVESQASNLHKAEALGLMSLRNYATYIKAKNLSLELDLIPPWIPQKILELNPLITITDTRIIFVTEI